MNLKVCVVGHGHLGRWHCEKVFKSQLAQLHSIVDMSEESRHLAKKNFPTVKVAQYIEEVIQDVDAFILVTPTSTHASLLKLIIAHKKHVFCEKPLSFKSIEVEGLKAEIDSNQLIVQVGHSERFHSIWKRIKDFDSEILSSQGLLTIQRMAPFKGRGVDVDVVSDLMIHDLDLSCYLLKEFPIKLKAVAFKTKTNHWDFCNVDLIYKSGRKVQLTTHRNHSEEIRKFNYYSDKGNLSVDLLTRHFSKTSSENKNNCELTYEANDLLELEQISFFNSILKSQLPVVTFEEGYINVKLVESIHQSIETGNWICPEITF